MYFNSLVTKYLYLTYCESQYTRSICTNNWFIFFWVLKSVWRLAPLQSRDPPGTVAAHSTARKCILIYSILYYVNYLYTFYILESYSRGIDHILIL